MRQRILLVAVLAACLLVPATAAAKPPSFKQWVTAWSATTDKLADTVGNGCIKQLGNNDAKVGACFVKGMRTGLRAATPRWTSGVAAIAQKRTGTCRTAILGYAAASKKMQAANLAYLDAHPHTALSLVIANLKAAPYATYRAASNRAKAHAIQICG